MPALSGGGLERGPYRDTAPDFQAPGMHDELKYHGRSAPMMKPAEQTLTFRDAADRTALPSRHLGSSLPGKGLGGAGVHWNGQTYRFLPYDFAIRSICEARYGPSVPRTRLEPEPSLRRPLRPDGASLHLSRLLPALRLRLHGEVHAAGLRPTDGVGTARLRAPHRRLGAAGREARGRPTRPRRDLPGRGRAGVLSSRPTSSSSRPSAYGTRCCCS